MGVNHYIETHPNQFDKWVKPFFTGYDVHASEIGGPSRASIHKFLAALKKWQSSDDKTASSLLPSKKNPFFDPGHSTMWAHLVANYKKPNPDVGSNAWALAPSRTTSGHAILLRNPHLSWNAGYYEAQIRVPGKLDFYGDFRIGGPFGTVGGFNRHLGWVTTNDNPVGDEIYAFKVDPKQPGHYLLDGSSVPIQRRRVRVEFKNGNGFGKASRTFLSTPYGPVIYRGNGRIYIIDSANDGEFRQGEQFMRMMEAHSLAEWKKAVSVEAKPSSNFTYADGDGNIFYVWYGAIPELPEPWGGDTTAVLVKKSDQIWKHLIPFDKLPHLKNPNGGYVLNSNDPFYYTNLNEIFDKDDFPAYFPKPRFGLRSQKSNKLIGNKDQKLTLRDIIKLKYNEGMLLADRVKGDLLKTVQNTHPTGEVAKAIKLIEKWNNTTRRDSRGSVLFAIWWWRYVDTADTKEVEPSPASVGFAAPAEKLFKKVWAPNQPAKTPYGLADPSRAVKAFKWAVKETKKRYGEWDVSWGKVHRAIAHDINLPIGGCSGLLGCFRVIWYNHIKLHGKNKLKARGGDGWVLAVEFDKVPKAYSVLAYGESSKKDSPYYYDQIKLFTNKKMKKVAFTPEQIQKQLILEYHPGQEKHKNK
jgi:acyl-homoserine-lactone acylase